MLNIMKYLVILCKILTFIPIAHNIKWMIDNPDFDDPSNWFNNYLPCAQEEVVFLEEYWGLLPLPSSVAVKGFVLPRNGALLLQQDASIILNGNSGKKRCQRNKAYIRPPKVNKWFNPRTWRSLPENLNNKAVSPLVKVPCNNESVIIQNKGPLTLDLGHVPYLRVGQLSFAGSLLSKDFLRHFLNTDLGEIVFRNYADITVEYYHSDICGCHKNANQFLGAICHSIMESCENPRCDVSIKPLGSCCAICGASLTFSVNYCDDKNLHTMQSIIEWGMKELHLQNDLDYYVNYFNTDYDEYFLQAVVVDRKEYSGKSVSFVKYLNDSVNWLEKLKLQSHVSHNVQYSGKPYNPKSTFASFILVTFGIVLVFFIVLIIFAHFEPNHRYLSYIPQWLYDPRSWLRFNWQNLLPNSNLMFVRFENSRFSTRTTNGESDVPVVMAYDVENDLLEKRSFDNPLFNEQPNTSNESVKQISTKNLLLEPVVHFNKEIDNNTDDEYLASINMNILSSKSLKLKI